MVTPKATPIRSADGGVIAMLPDTPLADPTKAAPPYAVIYNHGREWPQTKQTDCIMRYAESPHCTPPAVKDLG